MIRARYRWVAAALVAAAIFAASSVERLPSPTTAPGSDKIAHAAAYFIFAAFLYWALSASKPRVKAALLAAVIAALYGATDEIHQAFVPGRHASPADWLADATGAFLWAGWIVCYDKWKWKRSTPRRRRPEP